MKTLSEVISHAKVTCSDVRLEAARELSNNYIVQPKYDGWWCLAVADGDGNLRAYSVGAELKMMFAIPEGIRGVWTGEMMYGTNWAAGHRPGHLYIYDTLYQTVYGLLVTVMNLPYSERYERAVQDVTSFCSDRVHITPTYSIDNIEYAWNHYVMEKGFEGLVLKRKDHVYDGGFLRIKRTFTMEYVLMDIVEGGGKHRGRTGALVGGLYKNGKLSSVCSIGTGLSDIQRQEIWDNRSKYMGQVFEATGKGLFEGGALRHPAFYRWRADKSPEACIWDGRRF
jgi:hypothetical protein